MSSALSPYSDHITLKNTRRRHRKSRRGCKQCKAARVKCDEHTPLCGLCYKKEIRCSYLDFSREDLDVFHRSKAYTMNTERSSDSLERPARHFRPPEGYAIDPPPEGRNQEKADFQSRRAYPTPGYPLGPTPPHPHAQSFVPSDSSHSIPPVGLVTPITSVAPGPYGSVAAFGGGYGQPPPPYCIVYHDNAASHHRLPGGSTIISPYPGMWPGRFRGPTPTAPMGSYTHVGGPLGYPPIIAFPPPPWNGNGPYHHGEPVPLQPPILTQIHQHPHGGNPQGRSYSYPSTPTSELSCPTANKHRRSEGTGEQRPPPHVPSAVTPEDLKPSEMDRALYPSHSWRREEHPAGLVDIQGGGHWPKDHIQPCSQPAPSSQHSEDSHACPVAVQNEPLTNTPSECLKFLLN